MSRITSNREGRNYHRVPKRSEVHRMGRNTWSATMTSESEGRVTVTTRVRLETRATWGEPTSTTYNSWVAAAVAVNREAATMSRRGWATKVVDETDHE